MARLSAVWVTRRDSTMSSPAAKGVPGAKALKGGWDEWMSRGEKVER